MLIADLRPKTIKKSDFNLRCFLNEKSTLQTLEKRCMIHIVYVFSMRALDNERRWALVPLNALNRFHLMIKATLW